MLSAEIMMWRRSFLPAEIADMDPNVDCEGTDAMVWTWSTPDKGKFLGIAFVAKQTKPIWHHIFHSDASRQKMIVDLLSDRRARAARKADESAKRKSFVPNIALGTVFSTSWGYDQTNVEFFEVVGHYGKKGVQVRPVSSRVVSADGGCNYVMPNIGSYCGEATKHIVSTFNSLTIDGHHAHLWGGNPQYETAFGWGH